MVTNMKYLSYILILISLTACQKNSITIDGIYKCNNDTNTTESFIVNNGTWDASENGLWASKDLAGFNLTFVKDKTTNIYIANIYKDNKSQEFFRMKYNQNEQSLTHLDLPIKCIKEGK